MDSRLWLRASALCLAAASLPARAAVPPVALVDLHGIAQAAHRPAPRSVVWLDAPGLPVSEATSKTIINQNYLSFSPEVLVVRVGTTVDFPNNDRVFHNVFSFKNGKRFDLGLYPVGSRRRVTFDRPGLSRIFCNIHPNMAAYVVAVDTPYFAVSDDTGAFTIGSVPPGGYTYHAWRSGEKELTGTWNSGEILAIDWP